MIINDKRALAHIQEVHNIQPIAGADNIELVHVLGWSLIAKKGEFKEGDLAVYIEIDSQVPASDERFAFLANKHFKVKTYKLNKFKVVSQGLALPITSFPELKAEINTDVTDALGITYAVKEDNARKANINPLSVLKQRKPKLFKKPFIKWLMKYKWGQKLILLIWGKKSDSKTAFPTHLCSKTDEERVENIPDVLGTGPYSYSEKLDGSSATYAMERKTFGYEFYVCSRNVRQIDMKQVCFYDENIYWEQAIRYNIEETLKYFLKTNPYAKSIVIQGEIVGPKVQKKTYNLKERELYVFNIIIDGKRMSNEGMVQIAETWGLMTVPVLGIIDKLPTTMEEMKEMAEGQSIIDAGTNREGLVYRGLQGQQGFKNVSLSYLLEK